MKTHSVVDLWFCRCFVLFWFVLVCFGKGIEFGSRRCSKISLCRMAYHISILVLSYTQKITKGLWQLSLSLHAQSCVDNKPDSHFLKLAGNPPRGFPGDWRSPHPNFRNKKKLTQSSGPSFTSTDVSSGFVTVSHLLIKR